MCDTFSLVLNLSGYNKSASCAPRNGPFHPWLPRNRSLRVSLWRSCARLQHHPSPSSLYKFPLANSSHSIDLCSPFARLDRRRSGSCRKMAPILSSHSPASCLPASRHSSRSPLWPRLTRLPLWSWRQPPPHCSRSKSPPVFSRVLVRRPDRSASSAPLAPRCSTLWSHRRRLPRRRVLLSSRFSGPRLCQRLLDACFPVGHSRIFFHGFIHASSRGVRRARARVKSVCERPDRNRESKPEDHDRSSPMNEPPKESRPQQDGADDDQRAKGQPLTEILHPDVMVLRPPSGSSESAAYPRRNPDFHVRSPHLRPRAPRPVPPRGRIGQKRTAEDPAFSIPARQPKVRTAVRAQAMRSQRRAEWGLKGSSQSALAASIGAADAGTGSKARNPVCFQRPSGTPKSRLALRCYAENASGSGVPIGIDRDPTNEAPLCAISMDCALFEEGSRLGAETQAISPGLLDTAASTTACSIASGHDPPTHPTTYQKADAQGHEKA